VTDDDPPMCLPVPYPREPDVQRRERSWTLAVGSRRLSFTRVDHHVDRYAVSPVRHAAPYPVPARRWSLMGAIAIVSGSVAGVATLGMAMNASRAATGPYVLSVAVPIRAPVVPVIAADRRWTGPNRSAHRQPVAADRVEPMPVAMPGMAHVAVDEEIPSAAPAPLRLDAMQPAVDAALRSGTLQQWTSSDGAERGFVVAGPAERGCRTLSILTRRDGGSEVTTRRECSAGTGDRVATP